MTEQHQVLVGLNWLCNIETGSYHYDGGKKLATIFPPSWRIPIWTLWQKEPDNVNMQYFSGFQDLLNYLKSHQIPQV